MDEVQFELPAKPGDALINLSDCFPDLEELRRDFDILFFLDLCAGIEAAVLHGKLFTVGPNVSPASNPIIEEIFKESILEVYQLRTADPMQTTRQFLERPRWMQLDKAFRIFTGTDLDLFAMGAASATSMAMDLALEEELDIPLVLSARFMPIYTALPDIRTEQRAMKKFRYSLAEIYPSYKETLMNLRRSTAEEDTLILPPVALDIINRARTFDELGYILMEARKKHEHVRRLFIELNELLQSKDVTPKNKLDEQAKLQKSINKLFTANEREGAALEKDSMTSLTSFARGLNDVVKTDKLFDDVGVDDFSWTKIIGYLLDNVETAYWKFRLRPLHSTKRRYLDTSDSAVAEAIKILFGHELTKSDVQRAARYEVHMRQGLMDLRREPDH